MVRQVLESPLYQSCRQLFCFVSLPQEPDTLPILRQALADGIVTAVPRCLPGNQMAFYRLTPDCPIAAQLQPGSFGVWEPRETLPLCQPDPSLQPVCLVPGLAFDRKGGRLGYGGGYYDRFLAAFPFLRKIGYAPAWAVTEEVPAEPTDQSLDGIATETSLEVWNG